MKTRRLGRTGARVSELCFGTMSFGGDADEAVSGALYSACRDAGVDFFDCADVYAGGRSEEILGRLIKGHRDEVFITSKCAMGPHKGASRRTIRLSCEASLRRLGVDRIDLYFMHVFDETVPLEETLRALEDLRAAGKVAHIGCSNYAAWQIAKANGIAAREGFAPFEVIQPMYNLIKRQAEVEILPLAMAEDLGVISYGPGAGGLLTGKYVQGADGRFSVNQDYQKRYGDAWFHDVAAAFAAFAADRGVHPMTLAVAWAKAHPAISCPIIGARSVEQLRASLDAANFDMSPELHAEIAALSRTPSPATDRLEEQGG
ncbi:aldo/keto reductase [Pikeienuella piscinae]|uniref:Aldo/keto reductase n=1 Tax=Pikeienuella piscinae TaxID=2748098 RepID=A0A7L5BWW6_9RHOB|nr:aldo/keto reductase [Pikeienuella piscinae]QIE56395.1 aldo/keto reductase [Pikeienuella piscinae]